MNEIIIIRLLQLFGLIVSVCMLGMVGYVIYKLKDLIVYFVRSRFFFLLLIGFEYYFVGVLATVIDGGNFVVSPYFRGNMGFLGTVGTLASMVGVMILTVSIAYGIYKPYGIRQFIDVWRTP